MQHIFRLTKIVTAVVLLAATAFSPLWAEVVEPFKTRFSTVEKGNIDIIGNTLMTAPKSHHLAGQPYLALSNDSVEMVDLDIDDDSMTRNSSSATLQMPSASRILFARLYWGAMSRDKDEARRGSIKFAAGLQGYVTITADRVSAVAGKECYSATADVTELVKGTGRGEYRVADILADTGKGAFAGWSLVVVYANDSLPLRFLSVIDGYANIPGRMEIAVEGFKSPKEGFFSSTLGVVAFDGEVGTYGDYLLQNGRLVSDEQSPEMNFFNSRISDNGAIVQARNPSYVNTMGIDIKMLDISGRIENGDTRTRISFAASDDNYLPVVVTFATDYDVEAAKK